MHTDNGKADNGLAPLIQSIARWTDWGELYSTAIPGLGLYRRLMLTERLDAASAGFQVGYESPSQFSREYSRLFGALPQRDISQLRQATVSG